MKDEAASFEESQILKVAKLCPATHGGPEDNPKGRIYYIPITIHTLLIFCIDCSSHHCTTRIFFISYACYELTFDGLLFKFKKCKLLNYLSFKGSLKISEDFTFYHFGFESVEAQGLTAKPSPL